MICQNPSCGQAISAGKRSDARYCSKGCYKTVSYRRRNGLEYDTNRVCLWCSESLTGKKIGAKYCGKVCKTKYENNSEAGRQRHNRWVDNNRASLRAYQAAYVAGRRAAERRATPAWLDKIDRIYIEDWYLLAGYLGKEVDHIVPLKGKNVCGLHVPWNMQLLSRSENAMKSNKLQEEYL